MDYINESRKAILLLSSKQSDLLFISLGYSDRFDNICNKIIQQLKKQNSKVRSLKQLRGSVIVNWLKTHNIRKVQYLAGHKYISSTEGYQVNNMDDLKEDVNKYHPDF